MPRDLHLLLAIVIFAAVGCDPTPRDVPQETAPPETETVEAAPEVAPVVDEAPNEDDPLAGFDDIEQLRQEGPDTPAGTTSAASEATVNAATPPLSCTPLLRAAVKLWSTPGPAEIVATPEGFVVAGYAVVDDAEQLFLVRAQEDGPRPLRRLVIPRSRGREVPPALVSAGDELLVGIVDGTQVVSFGRLRRDGTGSFVEIARNADTRYSPAVQEAGDHAVIAYTEAATPMRMKLARMNRRGEIDARHDLTPSGRGGSAPAFVSGRPRTFVFVDAHAGTSALYRVDLQADGTPAEPRVVRPVTNIFDPAELAPVARAGDKIDVGYTAIGNGAATAVGLVRDGARPAVALVPSRGYGPLHVDVVRGRHAVFLADSTKDETNAGPREVVARVVTEDAIGPPLVITGPRGTARFARAARRDDGAIGVVFSDEDGVYLATIRCRD